MSTAKSSASRRVIRAKSIEAFRGELQRAVALDAEYLVMHPGSACGGDRKAALNNFVSGMEEAARGIHFGHLRVLIENTILPLKTDPSPLFQFRGSVRKPA